MERFSRAQPDALRDSRPSSMASVTSASTRTTGYRNSSADSTTSRPTSYTPSYMNAVPPRKPAPPRVPANGHSTGTTSARRTPSVNTVQKGSLLVLIADAVHPSTLPYLETMLRRGAYNAISVLGATAQEKELKGLKIQIYALLGKLSHSSVGVEVKTRETWDEGSIEGVVEEAMQVNGPGEPVHGVLCSPVYGGEAGEGVMALGGEALLGPWSQSVGFLHGVAKAAIPRMRTAGGLFAVTGPTTTTPGGSPTATFYKTACEALIELLSEDAATSGVAIVHAENVLVPEPEPETQQVQQHERGPSNGVQIPARAGAVQDEQSDFAPSESPTKLWNMWALHEQLGAD